jgi:hypothetical protein
MPHNALPNSLPALLSLAEEIADGLDLHQEAYGIKQNTSDTVRDAIGAVRGVQREFTQLRAKKTVLTKATTDADRDAKTFIAGARDALKRQIGTQWSAAWTEVGFATPSLAVPETTDGRMEIVSRIGEYLTAHPERAVAQLQITAVAAAALHKRLSDTRAELNAHLEKITERKAARDATVEQLRVRLRGTIAELTQVFAEAPSDAVWYAFGLTPPGALETPDVPDGLVVNNGPQGSGIVHVDWDDMPRADRYRVWRQLPTEPEPVVLTTVSESEAMLANQPIGQIIKMFITALNDAGESSRSAPKELTVA